MTNFHLSYMSLASVYLMQGKHDEALVAANRAATIVPGDSITLLRLGILPSLGRSWRGGGCGNQEIHGAESHVSAWAKPDVPGFYGHGLLHCRAV